jgi:hypothetical protein
MIEHVAPIEPRKVAQCANRGDVDQEPASHWIRAAFEVAQAVVDLMHWVENAIEGGRQ